MYYYGGEINETSDGDLTVTVTLKKCREPCRDSASHDGELTKPSNENRELKNDIARRDERIRNLTDPEYGEEEE